MTIRSAVLLCACMTLACSPSPRQAARTVAESLPSPPPPPSLPDSLALRAPDGTELWFTDARIGIDSAGATCVERVMQLRRDTVRVPVPLLYTAERPRLVNDTLAEAHIYLNCRPGNLYRINLRNGQPIYVGLE